MKQNSITNRAVETGISTKTLYNWKAAGCNIHDDSELRERIKRTRHLPLNLRPEWMPRTTLPANYEIKPLLRLAVCLQSIVTFAWDEGCPEDERLPMVVYQIKQIAEYIEAKGL